MKKLLELRKAKDWSQSRLARHSGVSQTYISDLEANKKHPTVPILKKLAKALNVSVSELLDETSEEAV